MTTIICPDCHRKRELHARGRCGTCYTRLVRADRDGLVRIYDTRPKSIPPTNTGWFDKALCATIPGWNLRRSTRSPGMSEEARQEVCRTCPVRNQCDAYAEHTKANAEVWGGKIRGSSE